MISNEEKQLIEALSRELADDFLERFKFRSDLHAWTVLRELRANTNLALSNDLLEDVLIEIK